LVSTIASGGVERRDAPALPPGLADAPVAGAPATTSPPTAAAVSRPRRATPSFEFATLALRPFLSLRHRTTAGGCPQRSRETRRGFGSFPVISHEETAMPAKSAAQQKAAGAALSAKRGDTSKSKLKGASKSMMSMSEKELEKMAHTKRKGKPEHVASK
jgi:hypothetical protein